MNISLAYIAAWLQGEHVSSESDTIPIDELCIDSRSVVSPSKALFFALRGVQLDGHQFVADLYRKGCRAFVVLEHFDSTPYENAFFFRVSNVLDALQQIAVGYREQLTATVLAVTGSNGKTIVKEWLYQLLGATTNLVRSPRSYNSQIGVPLSVCRIEHLHKLAIIEAGISKVGEMKKLADIIAPEIGILTHIGAAHSEGFSKQEEKIAEKILLFAGCKKIITPFDEKTCTLIYKTYPQVALYTWSYKSEDKPTVFVVASQTHSTHTSFKILIEGETYLLDAPFTDTAYLNNWLTCVTTLVAMGMKVAPFKSRLQSLEQVSMRLEMLQLSSNCTLVNDTYNADIDSVMQALEKIQQQQQHEKYTMVLSDVVDISTSGECSIYEGIAEKIKIKPPHRLILIGIRVSHYLPKMLEGKAIAIYTYQTTGELIEEFSKFQFQDESILVKGARKFGLERFTALFKQRTHGTVLEVKLDALKYNLDTIRSRLKPNTKVMAMVKALGYGSGAYEVAQMLSNHGVDYLAVAYIDEGIALRKAGIRTPIMVMSPSLNLLDAIVDYNLEPVVHDSSFLLSLAAYTKKYTLPNCINVHLEIETGMHRLGIEQSNIISVCEQLKALAPSLKVASMFSHLAASEMPSEDTYTLGQLSLFQGAVTVAKNILGNDFFTHIANTAAAFRMPACELDMVRIGIGLYGSSLAKVEDLKLKPVLYYRTDIAQIRSIRKGSRVGYGTFTLNEDMRIATIRAGYADGLSRLLSNGRGAVYIRGRRAPVVGSVCMDLTTVDVSSIPTIKLSDSVEIIGTHQTLSNFAASVDTTPYEIMIRIPHRVKRIYTQE